MFQPVVLREVTSDFLGAVSFEVTKLLPSNTAIEDMWERSAVTPGVLTTSYRESSSMSGLAFSKSDRGYSKSVSMCPASTRDVGCFFTWPMPPEAPRTTSKLLDGVFEKTSAANTHLL